MARAEWREKSKVAGLKVGRSRKAGMNSPNPVAFTDKFLAGVSTGSPDEVPITAVRVRIAFDNAVLAWLACR
jgi:hypothetical protein